MAGMANRRSLMVLYSDKVSPIGHAVRIVLAEKDVNVEINYIEDNDRPEILNDLNPYNSILTLIDRDLVLYDAQIIMEYLDERFPHPPLMPVDPVNRAGKRQLRYRVMTDLYSVLDKLDGDNEIAVANAKKILDERTVTLETYDEFKSELEKGMLIKAPICDNPICEEKIKEETGADIRVIQDGCEDESSKCVYCIKQSKIRPFFARGY